jgi:hypothetical protein
MTSLEEGLGILSCRRKPDIAVSVGARWALRSTKLVPKNCAAYASISHIQGHNSAHGAPAFVAMENLQEQQLSLQLCIIAIMQKEELSDSRNRQAAGNQGEQNEGQIWQRVCCLLSTGYVLKRTLSSSLVILSFFSVARFSLAQFPCPPGALTPSLGRRKLVLFFVSSAGAPRPALCAAHGSGLGPESGTGRGVGLGLGLGLGGGVSNDC